MVLEEVWCVIWGPESRVMVMLLKSNNLGREIIRKQKCIKVTAKRIKPIKL